MRELFARFTLEDTYSKGNINMNDLSTSMNDLKIFACIYVSGSLFLFMCFFRVYLKVTIQLTQYLII